MKRIIKKIISILFTVSMLITSLSISIYAFNIEFTTTPLTIDNKTVLVNTKALESVTNITAEVAGYVAEFFV